MNQYRIQMGGIGAECYVFPVSKKQFTQLKLAKVNDENNNISTDDVLKIIDASLFDDSGTAHIGIYMKPDYIYIQVMDELDNEIMVLDEKWKARYFDKERDCPSSNQCRL